MDCGFYHYTNQIIKDNKIIKRIGANERIILDEKFMFEYNFNLWKNLLLL